MHGTLFYEGQWIWI